MVAFDAYQKKIIFFYKIEKLLNSGIKLEEICNLFLADDLKEKNFYYAIKDIFTLSEIEKIIFLHNNNLKTALTSLKNYNVSVKKINKISNSIFGMIFFMVVLLYFFLEKILVYLSTYLHIAFPKGSEPFILSIFEYILDIKSLIIAMLIILVAMFFMLYVINPVLFDKFFLFFLKFDNIKKRIFLNRLIATMDLLCSNRVDIKTSLKVFVNNKKGFYPQLIINIIKDMDKGIPFREAFIKTSRGLFPDYINNMILLAYSNGNYKDCIDVINFELNCMRSRIFFKLGMLSFIIIFLIVVGTFFISFFYLI